jgi:hypothetical protein
LTYFNNPKLRGNIRASKEEQYQEGFLRALFVIFGYKINPEPDFNLSTKLKNSKDSKKTCGAIFKDCKALAVIELKGRIGKIKAEPNGPAKEVLLNKSLKFLNDQTVPISLFPLKPLF